ncbi:MAG: hypothetical protein FJ257_06395 [Phycisphaerae bacterium]|nr:hypothetical protein [Phycisphaerae bacterium]
MRSPPTPGFRATSSCERSSCGTSSWSSGGFSSSCSSSGFSSSGGGGGGGTSAVEIDWTTRSAEGG